MKVLIVTDTSPSQFNGVVRTLEKTIYHLNLLGYSTKLITPDQFFSIPCPTYPQVRLAINSGKKLEQLMTEFNPDFIHLATEGPLGISARKILLKNNINFTTAFHTRFPEYISARFHLPVKPFYSAMRWFHNPSKAVLCSTNSVKAKLEKNGFSNIKEWRKGVDTNIFQPRFNKQKKSEPILAYVGRIAIEKNIQAFLDVSSPGKKIVIGDGPMLDKLKKKYPHVNFLGAKFGVELSELYSMADVFVFPSLTDTFGLVMLEALACGTPVAAFPAEGPIDLITDSRIGAIDSNLENAIERALKCKPQDCREYALQYTWEAATRQFIDNQHL